MNKEKILIIGCGQQARITIDAVEDQDKYQISGLVTNDDKELHKKVYGYEVICKDEDLEQLISENKDIVGYIMGVGIGTGSMNRRYELYTKLDKILNAVNVISPECVISKYAKIGRGNIFEAYTRVSNDVKIGNHCLIQSFTSINHDQVIGDNVLIGCNVSMAGISIGNNTTIADGSSIGFKKRIGSNCLVTDGTIVTKDLPDNVIAFGNPAKFFP